MRAYNYGFPVATLEPGETKPVEVKLDGPFRPNRLIMVGQMDEVRGHFKIKHSRLPLLDRENVIAYSNVTCYVKKRRTTVEYREGATGNFVRSYLPESVVYVHTDPLSYITLTQIYCDNERAMPAASGASALFFRPEMFGVGPPLPTSEKRCTLVFENQGDIQVRVYASVMGYGR